MFVTTKCFWNHVSRALILLFNPFPPFQPLGIQFRDTFQPFQPFHPPSANYSLNLAHGQTLIHLMSKPDTNDGLNQATFEQLFKTHFVHLCNFAYQYINDTEAAKDITQKVFIRLWENRENIDPKKSIQSYLFTSVRNRSLNYIRDQKKYRSYVLDVEFGAVDIALEEDEFALEDLKSKVAAALAELPEKCRIVFEMSRFQNMKYKEIAEDLDISVKTVEAHMSRALKGLKAHLKDYYVLLLLLLP